MLVKLFIYQDATIYNEVGITADSTLITADSTLITADQTFETIASTSRVAIPIDLFDDEVITLTSSIQNINDISKVFTDYTQSFTIPASKKNNETFRYWYENELDNGFNQLLRYDGYIEIDDEIFRVGKWQLESASVKQNKIENYKLTFYGVLTALTDKFREDKLKDIAELNVHNFQYSGSQVAFKIQTIDESELDVTFPLISNSRVWQYGGGGANDISNNATPMVFNELFPALRISKIFEAIESKYGVTFNGNFLTQSRFTQAYLWLKNKETFAPMSENVQVNFTQSFNNLPANWAGLYLQSNQFYLKTDSLVGETIFPRVYQLTFTSPVNWRITILKEGQPFSVLSGYGSSTGFLELPGIQGNYKMFVSTSSSCNFSSTILVVSRKYNQSTNNFTSGEVQGVASGTTTAFLNIPTYMPDIKVSDFVSAILKMFNLTAFSENESVYTFEQVENWYFQGKIKDLTKYTITDLDFERIKPYKKMNFQFEKSESLMNRAFYDNNGQEYGDLSYSFNTDGSDFTIKLPFENLLFNKFTSTDLQVGYSINKDLQSYIPKPLILYKLKNQSGVNFNFNNGSSTSTVTNYNVFGQDVNYQGQQQTLNFGSEISSFYLYPINNTLFQNYYFNYLNNLYSVKSRLVKVSMRLPYSELINLKLNDRIVIRDKRYVINQFTTNLKTFEVQMELIQDFRNINFNNSVSRIIDSSAQTLRFDTTSNEPLTWTILNDPDGQIISINDFDSYVEVETKQNFTGSDLFYSIISNNNDIIVITQNG